MLRELNWETLASRHLADRLVVHYGLVVKMPLKLKCHSESTHVEYSLAYHIPTSLVDYQKNSFSTRL